MRRLLSILAAPSVIVFLAACRSDHTERTLLWNHEWDQPLESTQSYEISFDNGHTWTRVDRPEHVEGTQWRTTMTLPDGIDTVSVRACRTEPTGLQACSLASDAKTRVE